MIVSLGIAALLTQYLKDRKTSTNILLNTFSYAALIAISVLGYISHLENDDKSKKLLSAQLEFDVLPKINEFRIEILDNVLIIYNASATIKNYLSFQDANDTHPELSHIYPWEEVAADAHIKELEESKAALKRLQKIAAEITNLNASHPKRIPPDLVKWAHSTLEIRFRDIQSYVDAYNPSESVDEYLSLLGTGYGKLIFRLAKATSEIASHSLTKP